MNEKLIIVKTLDEFEALFQYISDKNYIAWDTETNGLSKESHIIGFSVCCEEDLAYYVILRYWDVAKQELVELDTLSRAKEFMELLSTKILIAQNSPFDCSMVQNNFGVELMPSIFHDTMISGHLLNENRSNALKERGVELFGEDARKEQALMKESVTKNGGVLNKTQYELYKADADLIAYYGAKDAILTYKVFLVDADALLQNESLYNFFYIDESMPLLRGPTYDMNTAGLRVDPVKLQKLKLTLEAECLEAKAFIHREIDAHVKDRYPGTKPSNTFNIGAGQQRAWLLYGKLGNEFNRLTDTGKEVCKALGLKLPYSAAAKRDFIHSVTENKGRVWSEAEYNKKTRKLGRPKKVGEPWSYLACGKESLAKLAGKYKWVARYLEYAKNLKLLNTYVEGIQSRMSYNVIRPSFLQHGTTSGRYSSKSPNFQNLPRDDKRIKDCVVAREGMVFVGADYAQLEPRVFASISQDETLMQCFEKGEDFYSVVGAPIFDKTECSLIKDDANSFAKLYPALRDRAKVIALATPYGRTAAQQAGAMGISIEESQQLIDRYFGAYPKVELMMLESHEQAKRKGAVYNLFGRPRRMPEAMEIPKIYGNISHAELPYTARNILNLSMNHRVQSTGASIMNRAAIAVWKKCRELELHSNPDWSKVKIVMQVHDELILEGPEYLGDTMVEILKDAMENTVELPGVKLKADPKKGRTLAELK
jgi:DNA polymerase I-like protein with 3'-5' exonuclease and polymerase domains